MGSFRKNSVSGESIYRSRIQNSGGENAELIFGDDFKISAESTIYTTKRIEFGRNCLLSWDILIMDNDVHKIIDEDGKVINLPKDIRIGDNVWIGCRSTILKGSSIPSDTILAANSTIAGKLEGANVIFGAAPLRILREGVRWEI